MHQIIQLLKSKKDVWESMHVSLDYIRIALKEELQNYVLLAMYSSSEVDSLVFTGGTCLRKLYGLNRLSEDLDFENPKKVKIETVRNAIEEFFLAINLTEFDFLVQKGKNINRLTIRFPILYALGLSNYKDEKIHVKVELSPSSQNFNCETTAFTFENQTVVMKHFSLEQMFSGKIGACLQRTWQKGSSGIIVKGRDYFELIWYMQRGVQPDLKKLKAEGVSGNLQNVFTQLDEKVVKINFRDLYADLRIYFESDAFITEWCANFHLLYKRFRSSYS
ncbi:MAG: nucleotidyl transferase AbiEii/AbiGii toxin family protein [Candidatus Dojkabacteria bacterium]